MAPTLVTTTGTSSAGTSFSVSGTLGSPQAGDYRFVFAHFGGTGFAPAPTGWTLLGNATTGTTRWAMYGRAWQSGDGSVTFNHGSNWYWAYTLGVVRDWQNAPIVVGVVNDSFGTTITVPSLDGTADGLRVDVYSAFFNGQAQTATIAVASGQTGQSTLRPASNTLGIVSRAGWETLASTGPTGTRTGTYSVASDSANWQNAAAIAFAPTLQLESGSATTVIDLASTVTGGRSRAETAATAVEVAETVAGARSTGSSVVTPLGLAAGVSGSPAHAGTAETALALDSHAERINPAFTVLGLTSTVTGVKSVAIEAATDLALTDELAAVHNGQGAVDGGLGIVEQIVIAWHTITDVDVATDLNVASTFSAYQAGGTEPVPPWYDSGVSAYVPGFSRPLRFIAQDIMTGEIRDWDLPLTDVTITHTLSGPTMIRGRLGPEYPEAREIGLDAWSTWLHVEESGLIRASGIVQPLAVSGEDLEVEAAGFSRYPAGIPFMGVLREIEIDPAEVVRRIWAHLQGYPDGNLSVTVDATATPLKLGTPVMYELIEGETAAVTAAITEPANDTLIEVVKGRVPDAVYNELVAAGFVEYHDGPASAVYPTITDLERAKAAHGHTVTTQVNRVSMRDEQPYELVWWNERDCGSEIDNLARAVPFDFAENVSWNVDKTAVDRHLQIGYPRLGTRRFDLRFAEDENLLEAVFARETPDQYASGVILRGSGEGRDSIRGYAGGRSPNRVRRVAAVVDAAVADSVQANALAKEELRRRLAITSVSEITVDTTHDNAPIGSWQLGDDILIEANIPYIGELRLWHRIVAYTWAPDNDLARLEVRRSDQFAYGRPMTPA